MAILWKLTSLLVVALPFCAAADSAPQFPAYTAPPPPPPPTGIGFNASFGDWMVLQQSPAKACLTGTIGAGGTGATVKVASSDGDSTATSYTVTATVKDALTPGFKLWKACLEPQAAGKGDFTVTATCTGCTNATAATLSNVVFGDVWYCGGQSNMALPMVHSYSRNASRDAILAGKYANMRIHGLDGNMNPFQPWATLKQALATTTAPGNIATSSSHGSTIADSDSSSLMKFSATCYYFGQSLTDTFLAQENGPPPPIGLIHTAWGGSTIEQWLTNETIATCAGAGISKANQEWHDSRVLPYVDMTIKGWTWYQGENDAHGIMGNSADKAGYSCLMQSLVEQWRHLWSRTTGTTDPNAPFGIVTLASSGSEGANGLAMGAMRQAQTAGYGVLPPARGAASDPIKSPMANTFLAQAYDLDDQWSGDRGPCVDVGWNRTSPLHNCCGRGANGSTCPADWAAKCENMCTANRHTRQYMGGIHPRSKKRVGERLAKAAYNTVYGGKTAFTGPTLAGCALGGSKKLTIQFDTAMLRGDEVVLQAYATPNFTPYYHGHGNPMYHSGSQLYVQTKASSFCVETMRTNQSNSTSPVYCPTWAGGVGKGVTQPAPSGRFPTFGGNGMSPTSDPDEFNMGWINLPITAGATGSSITVDLSPLNGAAPTSVKYAWGIVDCCDLTDPTTFTSKDCIANCPIMGSSGLPANPFIAKISGGKCECVLPQLCDA